MASIGGTKFATRRDCDDRDCHTDESEETRESGACQREHDLKPNITTERTFLRRPRLSETRVSDTGGWAVSRADMLVAVYYRDGGMVGGVEEHWFNAGVIGRPDVSMSTPPSTANAFPPF